jgi:hypothetical protein
MKKLRTVIGYIFYVTYVPYIYTMSSFGEMLQNIFKRHVELGLVHLIDIQHMLVGLTIFSADHPILNALEIQVV